MPIDFLVIFLKPTALESASIISALLQLFNLKNKFEERIKELRRKADEAFAENDEETALMHLIREKLNSKYVTEGIDRYVLSRFTPGHRNSEASRIKKHYFDLKNNRPRSIKEQLNQQQAVRFRIPKPKVHMDSL